ncbi:hypothetical protein X777_14042 [Ooceraea biroi]|uniref:Uncharacterized protein n=1 Tax=Ooceraea biroi TaxID=2015173 RepID=A0A026VWP6_OOCBI|nr:hypothetical protein X777_14042 [Ooceraea biroi]
MARLVHSVAYASLASNREQYYEAEFYIVVKAGCGRKLRPTNRIYSANWCVGKQRPNDIVALVRRVNSTRKIVN